MAHDKQMIELSNYRLERSAILVEAATREMDAQDYLTAANRSYYAFFSAIRAVLALDGLDYKNIRLSLANFVSCILKPKYLKCATLP